jgi:hypothetical protein
MTEKWMVASVSDDGFILGYKILDQSGRLIAECHDQGNAHLIAQLPQLKELRYEWASIINSLAIIARQNAQSLNEADYAEEMLEMVRPYLGCAA